MADRQPNRCRLRSWAMLNWLLLASLAATPGAVAALLPEVFVSPSSSSCRSSCGATLNTSCPSLRCGMSRAANNGTVRLAAGLYSGIDNYGLSAERGVNGTGLWLVGAGRDSTIMQCPSYSSSENILWLRSQGFVQHVSGLTVTGCRGIEVINATLEVHDAHFANATSALNGTGIAVLGAKGTSLSIDRCSFEGLSATFGSALMAEGPVSVAVRDSNFTACGMVPKADGNNNHDEGGNVLSSMEVEASTGGAVLLFGTRDASFEGCRFTGNAAQGSGGAVALQSSANSDDDDDGNGGTHSSTSVGPMFKDCHFEGNRVVPSEACAAARACDAVGGAVYVEAQDVSFHRCTFADNGVRANLLTGGRGGALYVTPLTRTTTSFDLSPSTLSSTLGKSSSQAGSSSSRGSSSNGQSQSTVDRSAQEGRILLDACVLVDNFVNSPSGSASACLGGAFYASYHTVLLRSSVLARNRLDTVSSDGVTASVNIFNLAPLQGGAVAGLEMGLQVSNCSFDANSAGVGGSGGAMWLETKSEANITGSIFKNNVAYTAYERVAKGGAIAALSDGVLRIADSVFDSNRAAVCPPYDSGGAGSRSGSSAQPRQQLQCGSGSGGAIALQRSGAWLDRVVFENNVAEAGGQGGGSLGGAISVVDPARDRVRFRSCTFRHNAAWGQALAASGAHGSRGSGGAVAIVAGAPLFESTLFANNSAHAGVRAPAFGGALSVAFSAESSVLGFTQCVNCTFTFNRACPNTCPPWSARDNPHYTQGGHGGALAVSAGSVRLTNCDLNHNRAYSSLLSPGLGGALFATGGGGMEGENSTFSWNVVVPPRPPKSRTGGSLMATLLHTHSIALDEATPHESYVFGSQVAVVGATGGSSSKSPPATANFTGCGFWPSCRASQVLGLGDLNEAEAAAAAFSAGMVQGRSEDWAALLGARGLAECFDLVAIGADMKLAGLNSPWTNENPSDSHQQHSNQSLHALVIAIGGSHAEEATGGSTSSANGGISSSASSSSSSSSSNSSRHTATTTDLHGSVGTTVTDGTANSAKPGRGKLIVDTSFPAGFGVWAVGALVQIVPQATSDSSYNAEGHYDDDDGSAAQASASTSSSVTKTGHSHVLGVLKLINATLETAVDLTIGSRGVLGLSGAALVSPNALNDGRSSNSDEFNEYLCNPSARYASGSASGDGFAAADAAYASNTRHHRDSNGNGNRGSIDDQSGLPRCPLLRVRGSAKLGRIEPWVYVALGVSTLASLQSAAEDAGWTPGQFMEGAWEWGSNGHFAQAFKALAQDALSFRARNNNLPLCLAGIVLAFDNELADTAENGVGGLWGGWGSHDFHLPPRLLQQVSLNDIRLNNAWLVLAQNAALFVWTESLVIRSVPASNLTSNEFRTGDAVVVGDDRSMVVLDGDLWLENYDPLRDRIGKLAACEVADEDDVVSDLDNGTVIGGDDNDGYEDDEYSNTTAPYHLQVLSAAIQGASSRLVIETLTRAHRSKAYVYVHNASSGWAGVADLRRALQPESVVVKPSSALDGWPQVLGQPQLTASWEVVDFGVVSPSKAANVQVLSAQDVNMTWHIVNQSSRSSSSSEGPDVTFHGVAAVEQLTCSSVLSYSTVERQASRSGATQEQLNCSTCLANGCSYCASNEFDNKKNGFGCARKSDASECDTDDQPWSWSRGGDASGNWFESNCCPLQCSQGEWAWPWQNHKRGECAIQEGSGWYAVECQCYSGWTGDGCERPSTRAYVGMVAAGACVLVLLVGGGAFFVYRQRVKEMEEGHMEELVNQEANTLRDLRGRLLRSKSSDDRTLGYDGRREEGVQSFLSELTEKLVLQDVMVPFEQLTLEKTIGEGAMGVVYRAKFRSAQVAVKLIKTHEMMEMDDDEIARFRAEAYLMSRLRHPNLVLIMGVTQFYADKHEIPAQVMASGTNGVTLTKGFKVGDRTIGIICEYLNRGSLADVLYGNQLAKGKSPSDQAADAQQQALQDTDRAAHGSGNGFERNRLETPWVAGELSDPNRESFFDRSGGGRSYSDHFGNGGSSHHNLRDSIESEQGDHEPASRWSYEIILSCALQAARGVLFLHSQSPPIVHRDLKCSNLVIDDKFVVKITDFGMSRLLPQQVAEELDLINHRSASPALRGSFMHAPDSDVMGFRKSSSPNNSESERVTHVAASSDLSRDNNYSGDDGNSEGVNAALSPALNSLLPTALDDLEAQVGVTSSDPQLEDPRQQSRHPTTSAGVRDAGFHSSNGGSADEEQEDGSRGAPPPNSVAVAMPKPRRAVPASVDPADSTTTTADAPPQPLQPPPPVARSIGERVYITDGAGVAMTSNVGTVAWCAPEIFNNGQDATTSYSLAADTYSFGMCLYELAERRAPFDHLSSRFDIVDAVLRGDRPSITCPLLMHEQPAYRALMEKCWAATPELRPAFLEIVETLEELYREERANNKRLEAEARNASRSASQTYRNTSNYGGGGGARGAHGAFNPIHRPPRVLFDLPTSPRISGPTANIGNSIDGSTSMHSTHDDSYYYNNPRTASMNDYANAPSYFDGKLGPGRAGYLQSRVSTDGSRGETYRPLSSGEETPPPRARGGSVQTLARFIPNLGLGLFHPNDNRRDQRRSRVRQSF